MTDRGLEVAAVLRGTRGRLMSHGRWAQVVADGVEQFVLDGAGDGSPFASGSLDQVALVVLDDGDPDALEVEAFGDAEFDRGADAFVDAGAGAFEAS